VLAKLRLLQVNGWALHRTHPGSGGPEPEVGRVLLARTWMPGGKRGRSVRCGAPSLRGALRKAWRAPLGRIPVARLAQAWSSLMAIFFLGTPPLGSNANGRPPCAKRTTGEWNLRSITRCSRGRVGEIARF